MNRLLMVTKIILIFLLCVNIVLADSFEFLETRYSNAIEQSIQLQGKIHFHKNGLSVEYPNGLKLLKYEDGGFVYRENNQVIKLDDDVVERITQYFEILILLHNGDEKVLSKLFQIKQVGAKSILNPLGNIKRYIDRIELIKEKKLKEVKLFLTNEDTITISIGNEIR